MQSIPRLETDRLQLRALFPEDAESLFELYSDPAVTKFSELQTFTELTQAKQTIVRFTNWFQNDQGVRWGIFSKSQNELMGVCCFDTYIAKYYSCNVAYEIKSNHWGHGFATEAAQAIIDFAFNNGLVTKINRLQAIVHSDNIQSVRVLEKLNFKCEGTLRQYGFWDGAFHDMKMFSLLKSENQSAEL